MGADGGTLSESIAQGVLAILKRWMIDSSVAYTCGGSDKKGGLNISRLRNSQGKGESGEAVLLLESKGTGGGAMSS